MHEFVSFIIELFERNEYKVITYWDNKLWFLKHVTSDDYWLIEDGLESYDNQELLYLFLKDEYKQNYPLIEKNTSLLLITNTQLPRTNEFDEVSIENDPFYFKKYVLPYDDASFDQLKNRMLAGNMMLEEVIMKDEVFEELARNDIGATLLYSIVHKLPFIPIRIQNMQMEEQTFIFPSPEITELFYSVKNLADDEDSLDSFIENNINAEDHD